MKRELVAGLINLLLWTPLVGMDAQIALVDFHGHLTIRLPAIDPVQAAPDPLVFPDGSAADEPEARHSWKQNIVTTVFWVGESPTANNPMSNRSSSWDPNWMETFGGFDCPLRREGWTPKAFVPLQNPFYVALPYNDVTRGRTKPEAALVIPWFRDRYVRDGVSVLQGQWVAIRKGSKTAYAQWRDCGPFRTDHWQYVFGSESPSSNKNHGAGLDVSPAVRDFLNLSDIDRTDWRFVAEPEVPDGPWRSWSETAGPLSTQGAEELHR